MFDLDKISMEYLINFLAIFIPAVAAIIIAWWQYTRIKKDNLENKISDAKTYLDSIATLVKLMIDKGRLMNTSVHEHNNKFNQDPLTAIALQLPSNFYVDQLESIDYTNLIRSCNIINKRDLIETLLSHLYTSCSYTHEIERLRNSMFPLFDITKTKFDDIVLRLSIFISQNAIPSDVESVYKNYLIRNINSTNEEKESFDLLNRELILPLYDVCEKNNYLQLAPFVSELNTTVYMYNLNMKQTMRSLIKAVKELHTELDELENLMLPLTEIPETHN